MRALSIPDVSAADAFLTAVDGIDDPELLHRLVSSESEIVDEEGLYLYFAATASLSPGRTYSLSNVTISEARNLYRRHFARAKSRGRDIYDNLLIACAGPCPYCGHRDATTLDHYLPESVHSALTVTPANLVPACKDCNHIKQTFEALLNEDQFLHPYFDDVEGEIWLEASVDESSPAAIVFRAEPPASHSATLSSRIRNHFDRLGLGLLYAAAAAQELASVRQYLGTLYAAGGDVEVGAHLLGQSNSRTRHRPNSWQAAAYRAMASSPWFIAGGFALL